MASSDYSYSKEPWRGTSYKAMRKVGPLWRGARLRGLYLEMLGLTGVNMYHLLDKHDAFENPHQFVAGEWDVGTYVKLRAMKEQGKLPCSLVFGDIIQTAQQLAQQPDRLPLAVLNHDGFDQVGGSKWWAETAAPLIEIAQESVRRLGAFVLILNKTLDRRNSKNRDDPCKDLQEQTHILHDVFRPKWTIAEEDLLDGTPHRVNDRKFQGFEGAYEIYRSENRRLRMATLRLAFLPGKVLTRLV